MTGLTTLIAPFTVTHLKVAVTVRLFSKMTVQSALLVPPIELHPDQLANAEPPVGAAVSTILVPVAS